MNKKRYRLIFSKVRACLVPVPEIVSTVSAEGSISRTGPSAAIVTHVGHLSPVAYAVAMSLVLFSPVSLAGGVVPVPGIIPAPGNGVPVMDKTANGTVSVNIVAPDAQGLSHNRFTDFNVSQPGVVFNNSLSPGVSKTGGLVTQNPHLTHSATAILSEVTGHHASHIAGTLEVFGAKADLFIANPNGITLNGVTTLNVGRLGVTTGHLQPGNGALTFNVDDTSGRIVIGHDGVDTRGLSYFDIVSRGVSLNGQVGSADKKTDIQIVSGPSFWNAGTRSFTKGTGTVTGIAIDGTAAGSMYGKNVSLVSTATGAGVNQPGAIHASHDIHISADGDVTTTTLDAGHDIDVNARNVYAGGIYAGNNAMLNASHTLTLSGAQVIGNLHLKSGEAMTLYQALTAAQFIAEARSLLLDSARLSATGPTGSVDAVQITSGNMTLRGTLRAIDSRTGRPLVGNERLVSDQSQLKVRRADGTLDTHFTLDSTSVILSVGNIHLELDSLNNQAGVIASHNGSLYLRAGSVNNTGSLESARSLTLVADLLNNACRDSATGALCGRLRTDEQAILRLQTLNNAGNLQALKGLDMHIQNNAINLGQIESSGEMSVDGMTASLDNQGVLLSGSDLMLILQSLSQGGSGSVMAGQDMYLNLQARLVSDGTLKSKRDLYLTSRGIQQHGQLSSGQNLQLSVQSINNTGKISARNDINADVKGHVSNSGDILAGSSLVLTSTGAVRQTGGHLSSGHTSLGAAEVFNDSNALIEGTSDLTINAHTELKNLGGSALQGGDTHLSTQHFLNNHAKVSGNQLTLSADTVNNQDSAVISANNNLSVQGHLLNNAHGAMMAKGSMTLDADTLVNHQQSLLGGESITMHVNDLALDKGSAVKAKGHLVLTGKGKVENHGGDIEGNALDLAAGEWVNDSAGVVKAVDGIALVADALSNIDQAVILGGKSLNFHITGDLTNAGALIKGGELGIHVRDVNNTSAGEIDGDTVRVTASGRVLNDKQSVIYSSGNIDLTAPTFMAEDSTVTADGDLNITTGDYRNSAFLAAKKKGALTLQNNQDLTVDSAHRVMQADDGLLVTAHNITVMNDINNPGRVSLQTTGSIDNHAGIISGKNISISAQDHLVNRAGALLWSAEDMQLSALDVLMNEGGGRVMSGHDMTLHSDKSTTNSPGGQIKAGHNLTITTPDFINNSTITGDATVVQGTAVLNGVHHYNNSLRTDHYHTRVSEYVLNNTLAVSLQGLVQAGYDLAFNPALTASEHAEIHNNGGQILAGHNATVKGDLWNTGAVKTLKVIDILKTVITNGATARGEALERQFFPDVVADGISTANANDDRDIFHTKTQPSIKGSPDYDTNYSSLWAMLEHLLSKHFHHKFGIYDEYSDRMIRSLQTITSQGMFQQLMSAALGADWKSLSEPQLEQRWAKFKANPDNATIEAYASRSAEFSVGNSYDHVLGQLHNGNGPAPRSHVQLQPVQIGSQTLSTPSGGLDASFNYQPLFHNDGKYSLDMLLRAMNPSAILEGLLKGNPLFIASADVPPFGLTPAAVEGDDLMPRSVDDGFRVIAPLFESRIAYIDQSTYYGSEYFFHKTGYIPQNTMAVLGDAYLDHQLITDSITYVAGNFFAMHQQLSGTALVKQLLDNAGEEAKALQLNVGQPLTEAQYDRLKHDIIWYEPQIVNGHTVLAPKVYLAKSTLKSIEDDKHNSAQLTAGNNIHALISGGENNNGLIRAGGNIAIHSTGDFSNISTGGTHAGIASGDTGQVLVVADKVLNNLGGAIKGGVVRAVGGEGINSATDMRYAENGDEVSRHNGSIMSSHDVVASTPEDVAEQDNQHDNAIPQAKVDDQETEEQNTQEAKAPLLPHIDTQAFFSEYDTDLAPDEHDLRSVFLGSNKDINITGGNLGRPDAQTGDALPASRNHVTVQAGGKLNVTDVHDVHSGRTSSWTSRFFSSSSTETINSRAVSEGSHITSDNLVLNIGGDTTITGSEINAEHTSGHIYGRLDVKAGQDATFQEIIRRTTQFVAGADASAGDYHASASYGSVDGLSGESGKGGAPGARAHFGVSISEDVDMHETLKNKNSQLNLGGDLKVDGVADLGGADINAGHKLGSEARAAMMPEEVAAWKAAAPTLKITAKRIDTTKVQDIDQISHDHSETFIGYSYEAHSSLADVATDVGKLVHAAQEGKSVDPAKTLIQATSEGTQLLFGEVAGVSSSFGSRTTLLHEKSITTGDNVNYFGGNLNLKTTDGDITLNGVESHGGHLGMYAPKGRVNINAARSETHSNSTEDHINVGLTASAGVAPTGAGAGFSVGMDGSHDKSYTDSVSYQNSHLDADDIDIQTAKGKALNITGGKISGHDVSLDVGPVNVKSVQDSSQTNHTHGEWNISAGIAVSTEGGVIPTGSAGASGGKDWDNSRTTSEQSGIEAGHALKGEIAGNVDLTGAHITGGTDNHLDVHGSVTGHNLVDTRDRDGAYGGGGGGISKNGLPQVNINIGQVDQIHRQETQKATFDVSGIQVDGAEKGTINHDRNNISHIDKDENIAGNEARFVIDTGAISQAARSAIHHQTEPTVPTHSSRVTPTSPKVEYLAGTHPERETSNKPVPPQAGYDKLPHQVVVLADSAKESHYSAKALTVKKPDSSVLKINKDGSLEHVSGPQTGNMQGPLKVVIVGHGNSNGEGESTQMGHLDVDGVINVAKKVATLTGKEVPERITLLGCKTCLLAEKAGKKLPESRVTGQGRIVAVGKNGRKYTTDINDPLALPRIAPEKTVVKKDTKVAEVSNAVGGAGATGNKVHKLPAGAKKIEASEISLLTQGTVNTQELRIRALEKKHSRDEGFMKRSENLNKELVHEYTEPYTIFSYLPLGDGVGPEKMNSFENEYKPDEWKFMANFRNSSGKKYFSSDVAVEQYKQVSKKMDFYGQMPKRIIRYNVSNEKTIAAMKGLTEPAKMFKAFMTTPNGKATQRIMSMFDLQPKSVERTRYPETKNDSFIVHVEPHAHESLTEEQPTAMRTPQKKLGKMKMESIVEKRRGTLAGIKIHGEARTERTQPKVMAPSTFRGIEKKRTEAKISSTHRDHPTRTVKKHAGEVKTQPVAKQDLASSSQITQGELLTSALTERLAHAYLDPLLEARMKNYREKYKERTDYVRTQLTHRPEGQGGGIISKHGDASRFINTFTKENWIFGVEQRSKWEPYYLSDVIVEQYEHISERDGFSGWLPDTIKIWSIINPETKTLIAGMRERNDVSPDVHLNSFMTLTPTGKWVSRVLETFGMRAYSIAPAEYGSTVILSVEPHHELYDNKVIVLADNTKETYHSAESLTVKTPNSTVLKLKSDGSLEHVSGPHPGEVQGPLKVVVAGHGKGAPEGESTHVGHLDAQGITDVVKKVAGLTGKETPERVTLLGCKTCALSEEVGKKLPESKVTGQDRVVAVGEDGRKYTTTVDNPNSLLGNKQHWLDIYRQRVTGMNVIEEHKGDNRTIGDNAGLIQQTATKKNEVISSNHPAMQKTQDNNKRSHSEHYLVNVGSDPTEVKLLKQQINNDNISLFMLDQNNAKQVINSIISGADRRIKNEYIFALSESKGLRILTKGFNSIGFSEEAFHHQNIFINDKDILSAGTIYTNKKKIVITNFSGHFKPSEDSLHHMTSFLKSSGVNKKDFHVSDYKKIDKTSNDKASIGNRCLNILKCAGKHR